MVHMFNERVVECWLSIDLQEIDENPFLVVVHATLKLCSCILNFVNFLTTNLTNFELSQPCRMLAIAFTIIIHCATVLSFDDPSLSRFKSWTTSDDTLPAVNRDSLLGYDSSFDVDSIWIIGGTADSNSVYRYSIRNDTVFSGYPTLTSDSNRWARANPGSRMHNDTVYFITDDGDFRLYNTTTHTEITLEATGLYRSCLTAHPTDEVMLYLQSSGTDFYICNVDINISN